MRIDLGDVLLCLLVVLVLACLGCAQSDAPGLDTGTWSQPDVVAPGEAEAVPAPPGDVPSPQPPPRGIWVAGLPADVTVEACKRWAYTGLSCHVATYPWEAWLTLVAEPEPNCLPRPDGDVWIGSGWWRNVSIHFSCFRGQVTIDDDITEHYIAAVAHEIGHALGLDHVDDPGALMYPRLTYNRSIADADRMEFLRVWGTNSPP